MAYFACLICALTYTAALMDLRRSTPEVNNTTDFQLAMQHSYETRKYLGNPAQEGGKSAVSIELEERRRVQRGIF